ncbi:MAG: T9SS type A sorting domain-containing protein [Saprospiraceae bacterium]
MDTPLVPSQYKFPESWNGGSHLIGNIVYVTWTRNEIVVEEGLTAFILSDFGGSNHLTLPESIRIHNIGHGSSNNGAYCFEMVDLFGCKFEDCKNFSIQNGIWGFDHRWIRDGKILSDSENQDGREFEALTGFMKCQSCRAAYEYTFPLRTNCNTDEIPNRFMYEPNDQQNPCQGGGTIKYDSYNGQDNVEVIIEVELPEAELATFIQGEECGCLFPPGVIEALETIHPVTGAPFPVYVNIECNPESPPPCNINDPTCTECDIIIDENCVYQGVCLDEDEPFINLPNLGSAVKSCIIKTSEPGSYARIRYYCSGDPCNMDFWGDSFSFTTEEELNDYLEVHPTDTCQACPQAFQDPPTNNQLLLSSEVAPIIDRNEGLKAIEEKDLKFRGFHTSVFPNPFASDFSVRIKRLKGGKTSLTLIDLTGKRLQVEAVETIEHETQVFPFKMARDLPSGMYQLLIETDQGHRSIHRIVHLKE